MALFAVIRVIPRFSFSFSCTAFFDSRGVVRFGRVVMCGRRDVVVREQRHLFLPVSPVLLSVGFVHILVSFFFGLPFFWCFRAVSV